MILHSLNFFPKINKLVYSGYAYADKSMEFLNLIDNMEIAPRLAPAPNIFLMIRPRGFGLSLAVNAIENVLERYGIDDKQETDSLSEMPEHHVITLDLKDLDADTPEQLEEKLLSRIQQLYWVHHIESHQTPYTTSKTYFAGLISSIYESGGPVVILIDNYDRPFIVASKMPAELRDQAIAIYLDMLNVIKHSAQEVQWCLLSGHIKFELASEISEGLPIVNDISNDPAYETLFGFTIQEVEEIYSEELANIAPHQGLSVADFLYSLEKSYGGFIFSDNLKPVLCPACISHVLANDGSLYTYSAQGNYNFLYRALTRRELNLGWLYDKDGQDPIFSNSIDLEPTGKQLGALLIQLGFATRNKVTVREYEGYTTWRYRYSIPNEDMRLTLDMIIKNLKKDDKLMKIHPLIVDQSYDFDYLEDYD